ncbi:hypothetical protein BLX88_10215 [Bacillus obstructivus]|nr:hypothetical protein BLX88_10215 [Bacillus obstructivus]
MKNVVSKTIIILISVVIVIGASLIIGVKTNASLKTRYYVFHKYGMFIDIIDREGGNRLELGYDRFTVSPKNNKRLTFTVYIDYTSNKITDTYDQGLKTYKEEKKLNKEISSQIYNLGFKDEFSNYIDLQFVAGGENNYKNLLYLSTEKPIQFNPFKEKKRYYQLLEVLKKSHANIHKVIVTDANSNSLQLDKYMLQNDLNSDEFLTRLKIANWELASYYSNKKWSKELDKIKNERFYFGSQYDKYTYNCQVMNQKAECTTILVIVTYQNGGLNMKNPYLKEDLKTIFNFFDHTMKPKPRWEILFVEPDTQKSVRFFESDRNRFKNIDVFLMNYFK